jgi:hypothetical protein
MDELQIKQLIKKSVVKNIRESQEQNADYLAELLLKKINIASIQKAESDNFNYVSANDDDWRIVKDWVKTQIEREKRFEEQMSTNKIKYFFKGVFIVLGVVFGALGIAAVSLIERIGG